MSDKFLFPPKAQATVSIAGTDVLFPVHRIFCVGRNSHLHASEMGKSVDKSKDAPFYFTKHPTCLIPSGSVVTYPPQTSNYHYEMELVVAIGKEGFEVIEGRAHEIIFGYAAGLDMTRRDLQLGLRNAGRPWDLGKDFEESAVLSRIVPIEKTGFIENGNIELSVNGVVKQKSDLNKLIWNVREIVADLSKFYHLQPGDLIYTGTQEGVGPVVPGDHITGFVENVAGVELTIK
jgi:fumarylpyruvate hydrolase